MRILVLIIFLLAAFKINAATNTAASASLADVTSAYALCSDGDILSVPAGTATWTSTFTINKAIQLIGAGIDQTIITDGTGNNTQLIVWNTVSNTLPRLSGFTFTGPGGSDANTGAILLDSTIASSTRSINMRYSITHGSMALLTTASF